MSRVEVGTSPAGLTQLVRIWAAEGPWAQLLVVHGLGEHIGRYERTGTLLARAGISVIGFDLAGFGGSGGERGHVERWEDHYDAIDAHMSGMMTGVPTALLGHSWGGLIVLGYQAGGRTLPDALVATSPALAGGAAWQRALAPLAAAVAPKVRLPNQFDGEKLSRDPSVGEAYVADPLVETASTFRLGALTFKAMAEINDPAFELRTPTLVLHGAADPIVPPQSTAFLGTLDNCERRVYPALRHEILNEPEGPQVVEDVVDWLKVTLLGSSER